MPDHFAPFEAVWSTARIDARVMPPPRRRHSATLFDGKLYIFVELAGTLPFASVGEDGTKHVRPYSY